MALHIFLTFISLLFLPVLCPLYIYASLFSLLSLFAPDPVIVNIYFECQLLRASFMIYLSDSKCKCLSFPHCIHVLSRVFLASACLLATSMGKFTSIDHYERADHTLHFRADFFVTNEMFSESSNLARDINDQQVFCGVTLIRYQCHLHFQIKGVWKSLLDSTNLGQFFKRTSSCSTNI